MSIKLANAPCSWGIYQLSDGKGIACESILDAVSRTGYGGTELGPYGFYPVDSKRLQAELSQRGLSIPAGSAKEPYHMAGALPEAMERVRKTLTVLRGVGAHYIVILCGGVSDRPLTAGRPEAAVRLDPSQWGVFRAGVTAVARMAKEEFGITAVLHPHAGSYVEFSDEIDRAMDELDPELVSLCIDTGHCAYAGVDPVALFETYRQRAVYFHFKNVDGATLDHVRNNRIGLAEAVRSGIFCPLDRGIVDFDRLTAALRKSGYSGWACIEQDHDLASGVGDPTRDAQDSYDFLARIGLAAASHPRA
jgi:inosose dehydratase